MGGGNVGEILTYQHGFRAQGLGLRLSGFDPTGKAEEFYINKKGIGRQASGIRLRHIIYFTINLSLKAAVRSPFGRLRFSTPGSRGQQRRLCPGCL